MPGRRRSSPELIGPEEAVPTRALPVMWRCVKLHEDEVRVPGPDGEIRTIVINPIGGGRRPGLLLYSDIFQLTESTLRTARRLASSGFVVCVPEIYPHGEFAGVALEFDDAGKAGGLAGAEATSTADGARGSCSTPTSSS